METASRRIDDKSNTNDVAPSPEIEEKDTILLTIVRPMGFSKFNDLKISAPLFVISISPEDEFSMTSCPFGPNVPFKIFSKVSQTFKASSATAILNLSRLTLQPWPALCQIQNSRIRNKYGRHYFCEKGARFPLKNSTTVVAVVDEAVSHARRLSLIPHNFLFGSGSTATPNSYLTCCVRKVRVLVVAFIESISGQTRLF